MDRRVYGFLLDGKIIFDIGNKKIIQYSFDEAESPMFFKVVSLNDTQSRLLRFLLINRENAIIGKTDIMQRVWDANDLASSNQRLWQSINSLRKKLSYLGMTEDFISNVHGTGYSIDKEKVLALYLN
jgi:DNA-binding winged-HTH domains